MEFRFQTGSIKSLLKRMFYFAFISFDSKLVRLKETLIVSPISVLTCFDSKLVRLKVNYNGFCRETEGFRFQTGSIKRRFEHEDEFIELTFRFQTGSIKRSVLIPQWTHFKCYVSIPNWFD